MDIALDKPIIVLGLGNPLMGDDGVGLVALERMRNNLELGPRVQFEDGGTLGLSLLPIIEDCGALLVLDAVRMGGMPGTIVKLDALDIPMYLSLKTSPHQTGFREALALARMRGTLPDRLCVVGVEVEHMEFGAAMSPQVAAAIPGMIEAARTGLLAWGGLAESNPNL